MTQETDHKFMLGVISGKIDLILLNQAEDKRIAEQRFVKIETSLEKVEDEAASLKQNRSWVLGAAAAISTIASAGMALLGLGR